MEVPSTLFGGFHASADITKRIKRLAVVLLDGVVTGDLDIYDTVRLWRVPNTRHGKTGLYKVPLTLQELLSGDVDAIRELARVPRHLIWAADDEWSAVPDLVEVWESTAQEPKGSSAYDVVATCSERSASERVPAGVLLRYARERAQQGRGRNTSGFWLALQLRDNGYSQGEAESVVLEYVSLTPSTNPQGKAEPYTEREALASLRSAYSRTPREAWGPPRPVPTLEPSANGINGNGHHAVAATIQIVTAEALDSEPVSSASGGPGPTTWPPTDLGSAERFAFRHGSAWRYCATWSKWLGWTGQRWHADDTLRVVQAAAETARSIYAEAAEASDPDRRAALAKWAVRSESADRLKAMLDLARSRPGIPILPAQLDGDPWLLNAQNGTLDLRTGELREHRRDDLITRRCPVEYDPSAECQRFLAFLDRIMDGNDRLIRFLQRASGYTLTGLTTERIVLILWGGGRNGKTTFLELLMAMLGDYAMRASTEMLLAKRNSAIPNDVARLKGARFVVAAETTEGRRFAESTVKELTGGDTVTARFLHAEWFDFRPEFKLWLGTNHRPVIRGTDAAIWDRIRLVPFTVRIPDDEVDRDLPAKLRAELPGVLRWAVQGCLDWQAHGLDVPEEVVQATDAYRSEMDVLATFLAECCIEQPGVKVGAGQLYATYKGWCEQAGEPPLTQRMFGGRLTERGFEKKRSDHSGRNAYQGLTLPNDFDSLKGMVQSSNGNKVTLS